MKESKCPKCGYGTKVAMPGKLGIYCANCGYKYCVNPIEWLFKRRQFHREFEEYKKREAQKMKCKIFSDNDLEKVEKEINTFLEENKLTEIVSANYHVAGLEQLGLRHSVILWYREKVSLQSSRGTGGF